MDLQNPPQKSRCFWCFTVVGRTLITPHHCCAFKKKSILSQTTDAAINNCRRPPLRAAPSSGAHFSLSFRLPHEGRKGQPTDKDGGGFAVKRKMGAWQHQWGKGVGYLTEKMVVCSSSYSSQDFVCFPEKLSSIFIILFTFLRMRDPLAAKQPHSRESNGPRKVTSCYQSESLRKSYEAMIQSKYDWQDFGQPPNWLLNLLHI